jgi:hypothetical protein
MIPGGHGSVLDSHSADVKSAFAATQRLLYSQSPPHTMGSYVGIAIACTYTTFTYRYQYRTIDKYGNNPLLTNYGTTRPYPKHTPTILFLAMLQLPVQHKLSLLQASSPLVHCARHFPSEHLLQMRQYDTTHLVSLHLFVSYIILHCTGSLLMLRYSVSLLAAFRSFSPGMKLLSPFDTMLIVSVLAVFYVDDGMPGVNEATEAHPSPLADLLNAAEKSAQSWERLLFASGGALELTKCFAYIIYWDLSPSTEPRMLEPHEIPNCSPEDDHFRGPLSLAYGDISPVRHLLVTESPQRGRKTLGARIAPAGNWNDKYKFRRKQGNELSLRMAGSSLAKETARLGYRTMICPA